ncbi:hypothetical protein D3C85_1168930 [compost metagenome]
MLVVAEQVSGGAFFLLTFGCDDLFDPFGEIDFQLYVVFELQGFQLGQLALQTLATAGIEGLLDRFDVFLSSLNNRG